MKLFSTFYSEKMFSAVAVHRITIILSKVEQGAAGLPRVLEALKVK